MKTVTVNISLARDAKSTAVEFRQHEGTVDPVPIKFVGSALGALVSYAGTLAFTNT